MNHPDSQKPANYFVHHNEEDGWRLCDENTIILRSESLDSFVRQIHIGESDGSINRNAIKRHYCDSNLDAPGSCSVPEEWSAFIRTYQTPSSPSPKETPQPLYHSRLDYDNGGD